MVDMNAARRAAKRLGAELQANATQIGAVLGEPLDQTDESATEAYRDNNRIFQALCTERDRLAALRPGMVDRATIEHTERLVERYAAKLRAVYSSEYGCYCVTLPSGRILPCDDCGATR